MHLHIPIQDFLAILKGLRRNSTSSVPFLKWAVVFVIKVLLSTLTWLLYKLVKTSLKRTKVNCLTPILNYLIEKCLKRKYSIKGLALYKSMPIN